MIFNFVVLSDYENISTTKISEFTVLLVKRTSTDIVQFLSQVGAIRLRIRKLLMGPFSWLFLWCLYIYIDCTYVIIISIIVSVSVHFC